MSRRRKPARPAAISSAAQAAGLRRQRSFKAFMRTGVPEKLRGPYRVACAARSPAPIRCCFAYWTKGTGSVASHRWRPGHNRVGIVDSIWSPQPQSRAAHLWLAGCCAFTRLRRRFAPRTVHPSTEIAAVRKFPRFSRRHDGRCVFDPVDNMAAGYRLPLAPAADSVK